VTLPTIPDPAGYRQAAAVLRKRADALSHYANRISGQVNSTSFEGPAATRLRSDTTAQKQAVLRAANELYGLAGTLSRAAGIYEAQIAAGGH